MKQLEPVNVFKFFFEISNIPRGSGNEKEISDYLLDFAKERNLFVIQDKNLNIIIKKPGTAGYENSIPVILQGHMDMVCEKNGDANHDFLKDPLNLYIEKDFLKAKNTTLGADNGIAIGMALAILDSNDLSHPPLEALFTAEEETGLIGATNLDEKNLDGKILINLDTEEEGEFCVSCAGGARIDSIFPLDVKEINNKSLFKISILGLNGGHSGMDINKGLGNSIKILGRVLFELNNNFNINIQDIKGGAQDNAIPREAEANIFLEGNISEVENILEDISSQIKKEYSEIDNGLEILIQEIKIENNKALTKEMSKNIVAVILNLPCGVVAMSKSFSDLVETSNNLGVIKIEDDKLKITCSTRSSVLSRKQFVINQIISLSESFNGEVFVRGEYPSWEFKKDSNIRNVFLETYKEMYNKEGKIISIHAGLECGIFGGKIENLDMISLGPDVFGAHTPEERLSISSTERVYKLLINVLSKLK